ncbi:MAG TPA: DNA-processing protein DprA [Epsilonproteobacteria bacterium]|nr:DNA-processing protein DprA [Campylobacterota bacterium]
MSQNITEHISALDRMKKYPKELFYKGNLTLLNRPKVAIVGSRRLSNYTREFTYKLSKALAQRGVCVVSGAAMGVDAVAHEGAGAQNTIAVVANGLNIRYPVINSTLIESIENEGLVLSQFNDGFRATGWSFVVRNELVVALGDILIVTEAELDSGSMRSVEFALRMGKEIYVLSHRLDESAGTNKLLQEGKAKCITDIDAFAARFGEAVNLEIEKDDFFYFCQSSPTFDETINKFGDKVYEAELEGLVTIHNGIVRLN